MQIQAKLILLLMLITGTVAQTIRCQDDEVIKVNVESVQTTLRVSTRKNKPVAVSKDDLRVFLDGQQQDISYFAVNQINHFVILLDASSSMRGRRFSRSIKFIDDLAENSLPGQIFDVYVFAETTKFIGSLTKKDRKTVLEQLKEINPDGDTALYESVVQTLRKFDKTSQTTALIVLTDGCDNLSSETIRQEADNLLGQFGTMTYLLVLDTRLIYRTPETAPKDKIAEDAVKNFQKILQPVAYVVELEIDFNRLADKLPREAGFLVRVGFDPKEAMAPENGFHKLEIIHRDTKLNLTYRPTVLMSRGEN